MTGFHALPAGLMAGIAFVFLGWRDASIPLLGLLFIAAAALSARLSARPLARALAILASAILAGALLARAELLRTDTVIISGNATVRIAGTVEWREVDEKGRQRYTVAIDRTWQPTLSRPPQRARILVASRHEPIAIGGRFSGLVRLRPPSGPALPGAYDFAFAAYFGGLGAHGFALGAPDPASPEAGDLQPSVSERIARLRLSLAERIAGAVGGPEGAVAAALVTGLRAGIPEGIEDDLRVTGLAHVLSISGFHMALVAGFTLIAVRGALAAIPPLALRLPVKKIAAAVALIVSAGYLTIAGDNVATDRSFIMLAIMLGAVLFDRPALTLRNVSIAAMVVLAMQPHALFTGSFQMSFAATAALVGVFGPLSARRDPDDSGLKPERGRLAGLWRATLLLALSSALAGLATAPFGAYHFGRLAPFGLVANLLLMPLFSLWIMPFALVATILTPLGLDGLVWPMVGWGLTLVFEAADWLAVMLPDMASGRIGAITLLTMALAILAASILASRLRWLALPLAVVAMVSANLSEPPPELLVFEDGKQVALVGEHGELVHLAGRPNAFVDEQWTRAFPQPRSGEGSDTLSEPTSSGQSPAFVCESDVCQATTRSGLTVAWTEDYERTGALCDEADIAIVARAIRLTECRSGARLVTLRTLRRTGSLAVEATEAAEEDDRGGRPTAPAFLLHSSIGSDVEPWNLHRLAPWPEYWINPATADETNAVDEDDRDGSRASEPEQHRAPTSAEGGGQADRGARLRATEPSPADAVTTRFVGDDTAEPRQTSSGAPPVAADVPPAPLPALAAQ